MGGVPNPPGSALRFSQPLSGFLAHPSFVALFHATTVPGIPPSEISPRFESRTPLRATCSRAVIHQRAETSPLGPYCRRFPRLPRFWRSRLLPPTTMSSLFMPPEGDTSWSLWIRSTEPLRSASFTHFEAFILSRVRSRRHELPRANGRSSLGFPCLSKAFSAHASKPRPAQTRKPEHVPSSEDSATRLRGTSQPLEPGETVPTTEAPGNDLVDRFRSLGDRPAPPFGGVSTPLTLGC